MSERFQSKKGSPLQNGLISGQTGLKASLGETDNLPRMLKSLPKKQQRVWIEGWEAMST